jgi:hypothetical protein
MILTELGILIRFQLFYDHKIITSLIDYSCISVLLAESFLGLLTYFLPKNMSITHDSIEFLIWANRLTDFKYIQMNRSSAYTSELLTFHLYGSSRTESTKPSDQLHS